ncbi:hypothetical protein V2J09_002201 [Rumex salicifolius]
MYTRLIRALYLIPIFTCLFLETASSRYLDETGGDDDTTSSIYDALISHGLPMGLLPKGITNYTLGDEGRFEIYLDQACNAKLESELHFDRNVSGWLAYGQIGNLSGIASQELFLWFPVKGIRVDDPNSGLICFDVGVVSKQFSLSLFEKPQDCFAGADPPNLHEGESIIQTLAKLENEEMAFPLLLLEASIISLRKF